MQTYITDTTMYNQHHEAFLIHDHYFGTFFFSFTDGSKTDNRHRQSAQLGKYKQSTFNPDTPPRISHSLLLEITGQQKQYTYTDDCSRYTLTLSSNFGNFHIEYCTSVLYLTIQSVLTMLLRFRNV